MYLEDEMHYPLLLLIETNADKLKNEENAKLSTEMKFTGDFNYLGVFDLLIKSAVQAAKTFGIPDADIFLALCMNLKTINIPCDKEENLHEELYSEKWIPARSEDSN